MQHKDPETVRIVFFGTPELASYVLETIAESGKNVVAAVTAPDKPAGRGRKLHQSQVKQMAIRYNIPVLQPENLKSPDFINTLKSLAPDLQVVVAFRMLPEAVWSLPPLGSFNLHASLLPDYRGAAPINWVIINGEKETGITTFLLDHKIDTGNILFKERIPLDEYETAGSLHEKVKTRGARLVIKTIDALATGNVKPVPQSEHSSQTGTLNKAPKIYKEDCRIDWSRPVKDIVNRIHGLSPHPGAFTELTDNRSQTVFTKLFTAKPRYNTDKHPPGTVLTDNKTYLEIAGSDGKVSVTELQIAGKRRMHIEELLRGMDLSAIKKAK